MQTAPLTADSLRAVLDTVFSAPAYAWVEEEAPFGWIAGAWFALVDFLERLRAADPLLFRLGVGALIAILLGVLAHAAWILLRTVRHSVEREARAGRPPPERRDAAWYEREADRLAREGRCSEALQAAFTALALRLEQQGAVRYHPSRTPREYAREARLEPGDRVRLQELVGTLYRHVFGGEPCTPADYRGWRGRAAEEWHAAAA